MRNRARAWTIWVLVVGIMLAGAYVIVERTSPGLRSSTEAVPPGFVH